jgi:hypothetical protein
MQRSGPPGRVRLWVPGAGKTSLAVPLAAELSEPARTLYVRELTPGGWFMTTLVLGC